MKVKTELPNIFQEFNDARREGFLKIKEFKEEGHPVVGAYCTYIPEEFVIAVGATMIGLCSTTEESIDDAEEDLPRNLCPLIKSSYGMAKMDKCPYFHFSDLVVAETTCDGKTKMYEYMTEFKKLYLMEVPRFRHQEQSRILWYQELIRFKEYLEDYFQKEISDRALDDAIDLMNRFRTAKRNFYRLGTLSPSVLSGHDIFSVCYGSGFTFNKEETIKNFVLLTEEALARYEVGDTLEARPRILITGCPMGGVTEKIIDAIENNGGRVVAYENCSVSKSVEQLVDEDEPDKVKALADKYLNIGCACASSNDTRIDLIDEMIDDYQVDGVIDMVLQNCVPFMVESLRIKRFCQDKREIPYMYLETDYSQSDIGQLNTRVAAFIEMLEG
ncbi:2-hydroxyacyl-CoA dehydratase [Facklamia sp. DSM 111018]|uniref:2-hydroxyacyl-CoA dehydratase n=1 Tax=Facklamia lactis TaxID=2749967 RepID=A0ABS0LQ07_9LACT|nr:double-cubane-cluster-containing anaerobic reductase [Facklamia lactis]MBG9986042.1 2-hydroxyacyl-CoA dehydratase [Facklamia lactis]